MKESTSEWRAVNVWKQLPQKADGISKGSNKLMDKGISDF